jgi:hypothetical protein
MNRSAKKRHGSTIYLRGTITIIAVIVLALCIFVLPGGLVGDGLISYRPIVVGMYVSAIPFFVALYQAMKLLDYIDHNKAFSNKSVRAIKNVKYCAIIISALFGISLPYVYLVADADDAPGVLAIALVIFFASTVITTVAAVLQKLFQNAVDIKHENDLTV